MLRYIDSVYYIVVMKLKFLKYTTVVELWDVREWKLE